ncbi:TRAP transporter small permease [Thalassospira lucentensis]|uniref:TRAP transporter small permease n=1 Tax=Thalassospira lucentensis TaxID=168935 RepID=UPI00142D97B7|nr:TRAP transporter small permease subunit [Thalassospira lucentensis]NIZ01561.1 TRAP transporter small permease subunit [Thalassospira lucentensis]
MKSIADILCLISDKLDGILRVTAGFFVCVMVGAICLQVAARYGFASPPAWTEEVARYAMVWVGLLGASVAFKAKFDPALFHIPDRAGRGVRLVAGTVRAASVLIFLAPVLWYCFYGPGMNTARSFLARSLVTKAETFDMPTIFVAVTVPIFICAIFIHGLAQISAFLTHKNTSSDKD